jgi:gluconokinase
VGRALADRLGWIFLDADAFHPEANVRKMANGTPLIDADRWPWLDRLVVEMRAIDAQGRNGVLACSALKQTYRERLALASGKGSEVRFVHLKGDAATIEPRLAGRKGHYMPASLLASQFAALEEPGDALVVNVAQSIEAQVELIARDLKQAA